MNHSTKPQSQTSNSTSYSQSDNSSHQTDETTSQRNAPPAQSAPSIAQIDTQALGTIGHKKISKEIEQQITEKQQEYQQAQRRLLERHKKT